MSILKPSELRRPWAPCSLYESLLHHFVFALCTFCRPLASWEDIIFLIVSNNCAFAANFLLSKLSICESFSFKNSGFQLYVVLQLTLCCLCVRFFFEFLNFLLLLWTVNAVEYDDIDREWMCLLRIHHFDVYSWSYSGNLCLLNSWRFAPVLCLNAALRSALVVCKVKSYHFWYVLCRKINCSEWLFVA